jgi:hypothetical protein
VTKRYETMIDRVVLRSGPTYSSYSVTFQLFSRHGVLNIILISAV